MIPHLFFNLRGMNESFAVPCIACFIISYLYRYSERVSFSHNSRRLDYDSWRRKPAHKYCKRWEIIFGPINQMFYTGATTEPKSFQCNLLLFPIPLWVAFIITRVFLFVCFASLWACPLRCCWGSGIFQGFNIFHLPSNMVELVCIRWAYYA